MSENGDPLNNLIEDAKNLSKELKDKDNYAFHDALRNSLSMINKIEKMIANIPDETPEIDGNKLGLSTAAALEEFKDINVGLLAARALDHFEDKIVTKYADILHQLWAAFLKSSLKFDRRIPAPNTKEGVAYAFYQNHGFDHNKIWDHLAGIDFSKNVEEKKLCGFYITAQWMLNGPNMVQGNYYGELHSAPSCLGINPYMSLNGSKDRRYEFRYEVQGNVIVLKSTAARILDTWSVKDEKFQTDGGCIQYFNAMNKWNFKLKNQVN